MCIKTSNIVQYMLNFTFMTSTTPDHFNGWKRRCLNYKCYWIKKQIELFCIQPPSTFNFKYAMSQRCLCIQFSVDKTIQALFSLLTSFIIFRSMKTKFVTILMFRVLIQMTNLRIKAFSIVWMFSATANVRLFQVMVIWLGPIGKLTCRDIICQKSEVYIWQSIVAGFECDVCEDLYWTCNKHTCVHYKSRKNGRRNIVDRVTRGQICI